MAEPSRTAASVCLATVVLVTGVVPSPGSPSPVAVPATAEAPPTFVVAPAAGASGAMTLTVLGPRKAVRLRTADGSTTTLYDLPDYQVAGYVPTRDGWMTVSEPWATFHTARGETRVPIDGLTCAVAADGDVWLVFLGYGTMRRYAPDGRPIGAAVALPEGDDLLVRFVADGRLLLTPPDSDVIETWRPGERIRTMLTNAVLLAATPTRMAWRDSACGDTCAVHVLDLTTGSRWSSPLPRDAQPGTAELSDDGAAVAYVVQNGAEDPRVLVARRDDPAPRLVAAAATRGIGGHSFLLDFAADGRLMVAETGWGEEWVAYAWDGRLARLGVYNFADVGAVLAD